MKFFNPPLLIALIFYWSSFSQENQKLDSILEVYRSQQDGIEKVKTLQELFYAELYNNPKNARTYARKAIELSEKIDYIEGKGVGYYHLGSYYQITTKLDSALFFYEKSAEFWKASGDMERYATTISSRGNLESMNGNYAKANEMFDEAIETYKSVGNYSHMANTIGAKADSYVSQAKYKLALIYAIKSLKIHDSLNIKPWRIADARRRIGQIEFHLENYKNALPYYKEAKEVYESINDEVFMGHTYTDIGLVYHHIDQPKDAISYFEKSLEIAQKLGVSEMEGSALCDIGMSYAKLEEYPKAIANLQAGLKINEKSNTLINYIVTLNELGQALQLSGKNNESLPYLNRATILADSINADKQLLFALEYRAKTFEKLGNLEKSIDDLKNGSILKDSLYNVEKSRQQEELRTIYETEKKEQQIALQAKEITVLEQKAEISALQKILLGGLLVLSLFGFYGIRQKLKRNKLEKEKVDTELAFKKKELTTHALHLAKKNEVLEGLKQKAQELKENEESKKGYQQLIRTINFDLQDDNNWQNFSRYFEEVHKDFNSNVKSKYPQVTSNELRLLALLKMNLSSKEIANILNISPEGIKKARYRLRKKLDITTEDSLQDLVLSL
ncbi:MAG: tetratricopeptide repeat protein [Allomuricauda sp.]